MVVHRHDDPLARVEVRLLDDVAERIAHHDLGHGRMRVRPQLDRIAASAERSAHQVSASVKYGVLGMKGLPERIQLKIDKNGPKAGRLGRCWVWRGGRRDGRY